MKWNELSPRERDELIATKVMGWENPWQPFQPSTDIADAWQVVEKFEPHQITKSKTGFSHSDNKYRAIVGKNQNVAYANTAPEAICKAALLAAGVEIE
jgi:hypothetical protein